MKKYPIFFSFLLLITVFSYSIISVNALTPKVTNHYTNVFEISNENYEFTTTTTPDMFYKSFNFTYRFSISREYNSTHEYISEYINQMYLVLYRSVSFERFAIFVEFFNYNLTFDFGFIGIYQSFTSDWSPQNVTALTPLQAEYFNFITYVSENTYEILMRINIYQYVTDTYTPNVCHLGMQLQTISYGIPNESLLSNLLNFILEFIPSLILFLTIPWGIWAMLHKKKEGFGIGLILSGIINIVINSNTFMFNIIAIIAGIIVIFYKKRSE